VDSAPILERDYANLAGLGWFGKNTCLIDSKRGSWFFIGLLLLDKEFEPDASAVGSCGTCRLCIDACPTGALVLGHGRPVAVLDSSRCISYLTIEHKGLFSQEESDMLHGWLFGCDVCQEVCPFNQPRGNQPMRARPTAEPDFEARPMNETPDLAGLADISAEKFAEAYAGTAFMRAGAARMRRNAQAFVQARNQRTEPTVI
ncbi:MAG: 4Fe-4S dicluster domain-containing protein, partial [Armatimonadetes bacterium]|nr:4Fe-4S dicluster domain-containing protein [Armatimonadota bacterium]